MVASLSTLAMIVEMINKPSFVDNPMLKTIKPFLVKLNRALAMVHGTKGDLGTSLVIKGEDYDADTEDREEGKHGKK